MSRGQGHYAERYRNAETLERGHLWENFSERADAQRSNVCYGQLSFESKTPERGQSFELQPCSFEMDCTLIPSSDKFLVGHSCPMPLSSSSLKCLSTYPWEAYTRGQSTTLFLINSLARHSLGELVIQPLK